ncbi:hypothetical protein BBP40_006974 [Aspergillus hancockii]|nr:hypothetical protein BBP40_006974 [Aspergillus hancockii]
MPRQLWQCATARAGSPDPMDEPDVDPKRATYHVQEYVLRRGEYGWRDAESYLPILSRVIKVARFSRFRPRIHRTWRGWYTDGGSWSRPGPQPIDSAYSGRPAPDWYRLLGFASVEMPLETGKRKRSPGWGGTKQRRAA